MTRIDLDAVDREAGRLDEDIADAVWAVTAEARAGRLLDADVRQIRAKVAGLLDSGPLKPGTVKPASVVQALRGIHTDLDTAVAAYTEAVGR